MKSIQEKYWSGTIQIMESFNLYIYSFWKLFYQFQPMILADKMWDYV